MKRPDGLKSIALGLAIYEAGVIICELASPEAARLPTVSALSYRHRWVEAGLLAAFLLDVHHLQRKIHAA